MLLVAENELQEILCEALVPLEVLVTDPGPLQFIPFLNFTQDSHREHIDSRHRILFTIHPRNGERPFQCQARKIAC